MFQPRYQRYGRGRSPVPWAPSPRARQPDHRRQPAGRWCWGGYLVFQQKAGGGAADKRATPPRCGVAVGGGGTSMTWRWSNAVWATDSGQHPGPVEAARVQGTLEKRQLQGRTVRQERRFCCFSDRSAALPGGGWPRPRRSMSATQAPIDQCHARQAALCRAAGRQRRDSRRSLSDTLRHQMPMCDGRPRVAADQRPPWDHGAAEPGLYPDSVRRWTARRGRFLVAGRAI